MRSAFLTLLLVLQSVSAGFSAEEINDRKFGFSVKVPDPFFRQENDPAEPDNIHTFIDREPAPEDPATVIRIQRMRSVFDPKVHVKPDELPQTEGIKVSVELFEWNGVKLDLMHQVITQEDNPKLVAYAMQIPLQGEAVQLLAAGPLSREAEVKKAFTDTAADFKNLKPLYVSARTSAPKEPLSGGERAGKMAGGIFRLTLTALVILVILRAIMRLFRGKKNEPPASSPPPLP